MTAAEPHWLDDQINRVSIVTDDMQVGTVTIREEKSIIFFLPGVTGEVFD